LLYLRCRLSSRLSSRSSSGFRCWRIEKDLRNSGWCSRGLYPGRRSDRVRPELKQSPAGCESDVDRGQDRSAAGQMLQLGRCLRGHPRSHAALKGFVRFRWRRSCTRDTPFSRRLLATGGGMHGSTSARRRVWRGRPLRLLLAAMH
jgi:hypothetical protein